ncbi:hypothetical protein F899_01604 [Acinetobacter sp. CIP 101934]|uniref:hypothetical protein n=1 Tax=Acinetobacter sp. CIP 101934 TaxID=1144661 RepID=UPI0002CFF661|nr:hypothetical protein [Acinetobacter sp. CIP 101934]ENX00971.1 hypothetical protein F899_01604 [Acinetobacter sp. CIP 101934]
MVDQKELAIIPKGTKIQIMGCSYTLLEDASVEGNQDNLNYILKEQENFNKGIGVVSNPKPKATDSRKSGGKLGGKNNNWMY